MADNPNHMTPKTNFASKKPAKKVSIVADRIARVPAMKSTSIKRMASVPKFSRYGGGKLG